MVGALSLLAERGGHDYSKYGASNEDEEENSMLLSSDLAPLSTPELASLGRNILHLTSETSLSQF